MSPQRFGWRYKGNRQQQNNASQKRRPAWRRRGKPTITKQLLQVEKQKAKQRDLVTAADANATLATLSRDLRQLKTSLSKGTQQPIVVIEEEEEEEQAGRLGAPNGTVPAAGSTTYASALLVGDHTPAPLRPVPDAPNRQEQDAALEQRLGLDLDEETRAQLDKKRGSVRFGYSPIVAASLVVDNVPENPTEEDVYKTLTTNTDCKNIIFDVSQIGHASQNEDKEKKTRVRYEIFYHPEHEPRVRELLQYFRWRIDALYDPMQPSFTRRHDKLAVELAKANCAKRYSRLRGIARPETRNCLDAKMDRYNMHALYHGLNTITRKKKRRGKKTRGGAPNGRVLTPYDKTSSPAAAAAETDSSSADVEMTGVVHHPRPSTAGNETKKSRQYIASHWLNELQRMQDDGELVEIDKNDQEWRPRESDGSESEGSSDFEMAKAHE